MNERKIPFQYREYTQDPLSESEIRQVLDLLNASPGELLRTADAANRSLGLTRGSDPQEIIQAMTLHPTLLQRPIGIHNGRAVLGRPAERLLELVQ